MDTPHRSEQVKKKLNRRPGACEPCRKHKIKCSGGEICDHCLKRKKGKNKERCWYDPDHLAARKRKTKKAPSGKASSAQLAPVDEESDSDNSTSNESVSGGPFAHVPLGSSVDDGTPSDFPHRGPPVSYPTDEHLGPYGMFRCINQFKKLSGASVDLVNSLAVVQCDSTEAFDLMGNEDMIEPSELIQERQEHSLSYLISEAELRTTSPDLQTMAWRAINVKDYQLDQGRIYEATFQQPFLTKGYLRFKARESGRPLRTDEAQLVVEQKVCKLMVDLEIRTKMHLGIPIEKEIKSKQITLPTLAFDGLVDEPLSSLEASKTQYRQTALLVLDLLSDFDIMSPTVEQYTELGSLLKQLKEQRSAFIDVATLIQDTNALVPVADYQIEHYSFAMMLACRLALCEKFEHRNDDQRNIDNDDDDDDDDDFNDDNDDNDDGNQGNSSKAMDAGIDGTTVIELCRELLQVFITITSAVPIRDSHNWTRSYAAYSAAAMLSISSIQSSTPLATDKELVAKTVDYFRVATRELANKFSALASERLEKLYAEMNRGPNDKASSKATRAKREMAKSAPTTTSSRATSPDAGPKRKRTTKASSAPTSVKRQRKSPHGIREELPSAALDYGQTILDVGSIGQLETPGYGSHMQMSSYEDAAQSSGPATASTSFDSSLTVDASLYPSSYNPPMLTVYSNSALRAGTFEHTQDWHPPIRIPHPPQLAPSWLEEQLHPGVTYAHHYNAQVMPAQAVGSVFPASTEYGASPVVAQMRAHGLVSPHDSIPRGPWMGNDDASSWSIHPQLDTRRSSDAFSVDQMRGYAWDAREGHQMMVQDGAQHPHNVSSTATEVMIRDNSQMGQHQHQHQHQLVNMTTGSDWRNSDHYGYDGAYTEHWPAENHGQLWTTPVS